MTTTTTLLSLRGALLARDQKIVALERELTRVTCALNSTLVLVRSPANVEVLRRRRPVDFEQAVINAAGAAAVLAALKGRAS